MFSILFKSYKLNNSFKICSVSRLISSLKEPCQVRNQDEETALKIEASLFDNSSVKYEPMKKEDALKRTRYKMPKKEVSAKIISRPTQFPSFKKSRAEREAETKLVNDQELGIEYLKLGMSDPRLSSLLVSVRSKKRRDKDKQIVIEGRRLILEALACGLKLNTVVFSKRDQLDDIKEKVSQAQKDLNSKIYKVAHHDLKTWSTLTTPPGVIAIFERPLAGAAKINTASLPITVICDNIREPNNLGSILRVCAALPCQQVIVTRGCCDPWESKALRGGCGGHFRLAIKDNVDWQDVPMTIPPEVADNCFVFVAENNLEKFQLKTSTTEYSDVKNTGSHNVVIIGGESHGVSTDAYRFMETVGPRGKCLYIPLAQGIESLNVASALTLILYELRKKILKSNITDS